MKRFLASIAVAALLLGCGIALEQLNQLLLRQAPALEAHRRARPDRPAPRGSSIGIERLWGMQDPFRHREPEEDSDTKILQEPFYPEHDRSRIWQQPDWWGLDPELMHQEPQKGRVVVLADRDAQLLEMPFELPWLRPQPLDDDAADAPGAAPLTGD